MSRLIKETDDELFLIRYLHDEPDSYSEWECENGKCPSGKYNEAVHEGEHYAAYELKMEYRINKHTGEVTIDKVS